MISWEINAQTPEEYNSFTISFPWSSEFRFRIFDHNGELIYPWKYNDNSFSMYAVLPKNKGSHYLQFDITSQYFIYSQESEAELYTAWVFVLDNDTMSLLIPNYPTTMQMDSIPFTAGQYFVSEDQFNHINLRDRNHYLTTENSNVFTQSNFIPKTLDLSKIDSFRFDNSNYHLKDFPNDGDMYHYDGHYKSNSFNILSHLKDSISVENKLSCELIELPESIPFQFIITDHFLQFNAKDYFIIDNKKDLKKALGENRTLVDIDFSKEIILHSIVGGDCHMQLRHQVFKDNESKIITWKIYNYWGGCRAGGRKSTWIKIEKPEEGFEVKSEIISVD